MMYKIKKIIYLLIFVLMFGIVLTGCTTLQDDTQPKVINELTTININIGQTYEFTDLVESSDTAIFLIEENKGTALSAGNVQVVLVSTGHLYCMVNVTNNPEYINVSGDVSLEVDDTTNLSVAVSPISTNQSVTYEVADESVASITSSGVVTALKDGFTTITVRSAVDSSIYSDFPLLVGYYDEEKFPDRVTTTEQDETVDISDGYNDAIAALIHNIQNSVVKVVCEDTDAIVSGVMYRKDAVLNDDTVIADVKNGEVLDNVNYYKYYVISNRKSVIKGMDTSTSLTETEQMNTVNTSIYLGENQNYNADLIQYDDKIDLSLLTFNSKYYYQVATIGNSDDIQQGEIVVAIGSDDFEVNFRDSTLGIITFPSRYIATDTDDDEINDWDASYIQFDASINDVDSGGALFDLKGNLIGINATKISGQAIENISCAIPIDLTMEIIEVLETGNRLVRPLLGVSIIDIRDFYLSEARYEELYPDMLTIPDGLDYGFYINDVTENGVADKAGILPGDIIIKFNGADTRYSYVLRAELSHFNVDSGETTEIVALRNGTEITITVTF
ncbi:MAG: trypsin-like peptidase domain-containing protein [Bacilli bacterium]